MNIQENAFNFAEKLESVYPLMDIIFEYLNDNDLDNVMNVKKSWQVLAQKILKKRSKPCWMTFYMDGEDLFSKSCGNPDFCNTNAAIALHGGQYDMSAFKPLREMNTNFRQVKRLVSRNITVNVLSCHKVVSGFHQDNKSEKGSILDVLFLPVIPGVRISVFYCNFSKLKKNPTLLENHIKANEKVKCLILFKEHHVRSSIHNILKIILKETKPEELALGGGIIQGSKTIWNNQEDDTLGKRKNETFCIAFTMERNTEPDFNAASYVISGPELTEEELNEKLKKFRKSVIMRKTSIAFRICCQEKTGKDKETKIFKTHFPNTVQLGLEVGGEVGWNCFNLPYDEDTGESQPKRFKYPYPDYKHEWSTVFIVVTWGDII